MATFSIHTLGCRANQSDSDRLAEILLAAGFERVPFGQAADCQIVNTCTVTREADRKSGQMIRRALRLGETVVATGCAVATRGGLNSRLPGSVLRLPPDQREQLLERLGAGGCPSTQLVESQVVPRDRTRALLRIQDGCDQFCTFCIVPYVRGRSRSLDQDSICRQAQDLERAGYREIVLTGIHLSAWGRDLEPEQDLADLVGAILSATQSARIRLSSVEPDLFPERVFTLMTQNRRLCPHLHLVLQHASDGVLERMHRGYTLEHYDGLVRRFFSEVAGACLTTDLMVGFPGESEADFRRLLDYVRATPFYRAHVFPYSQRPGTAAARFAEQVDPEVRTQRRDRLLRLVERKRIAYLRAHLDTVRPVLIESLEEGRRGWVQGTADNYLSVALRGGAALIGQVVDVHLQRRLGDRLVGCWSQG